jgi:hypothetical protein
MMGLQALTRLKNPNPDNEQQQDSCEYNTINDEWYIISTIRRFFELLLLMNFRAFPNLG